MPLSARFLRLLLVALLLALPAAPVAAAQWTDDVPPRLAGTWAEEGSACEAADSRLLIFSDGGYRWRLSVTKWGLARGQYRYPNRHSRRIEFRLRRFVQTSDEADYILIVDGPDLKKVNPKGRSTTVYHRCR